MPHLFIRGDFVAHGGEHLPWKVECDALTQEDLETVAHAIARRYSFSVVVGAPGDPGSGGQRLENALRPYSRGIDWPLPILVVDDVLTTGQSMEAARERVKLEYYGCEAQGVVLFARRRPPDWIGAIWTLWKEPE